MTSMATDRYLFTPTDRCKYTGGLPSIRARSSWELDFMQRLDVHPGVTCWNYEPFSIPYVNPLWSNRTSKYVPDFWVEYILPDGKEMKLIVEIKPAKHLVLTASANEDDRFRYIVNQAKWKAARAFAARQGVGFRVLTE